MSLKGVLILNKTKTLNEKKPTSEDIISQLKLTVNRKCPICVMMAVDLHLPLKLTASSKIPFLYPHSVLTQSTAGFLECHENCPAAHPDDPRAFVHGSWETALFRNRRTNGLLL